MYIAWDTKPNSLLRKYKLDNFSYFGIDFLKKKHVLVSFGFQGFTPKEFLFKMLKYNFVLESGTGRFRILIGLKTNIL